jgi:hypothetical protein
VAAPSVHSTNAIATRSTVNGDGWLCKLPLGDVVHLTLFSLEKTADGQSYHSFMRVIVRANQARVAR